MTGSAVPIVGALYAALGKGDWDAAEALMSADFAIHEPEPAPFAGTYTGPGAMRRCFATVMGTWEETKIEVDALVGDDRFVVALVRFTMKSKHSGRTFTQNVTEVATVTDGLVSDLRIHYFDPGEIAREANPVT